MSGKCNSNSKTDLKGAEETVTETCCELHPHLSFS